MYHHMSYNNYLLNTHSWNTSRSGIWTRVADAIESIAGVGDEIADFDAAGWSKVRDPKTAIIQNIGFTFQTSGFTLNPTILTVFGYEGIG